jgi:lycopene beta-cyclase
VRLNRLFFRAVTPAERWRILSRFYRLPRQTIERFYALETTPGDRARLLCGRPPRGLSLKAALLATQPV